jgi:hypothetical protein
MDWRSKGSVQREMKEAEPIAEKGVTQLKRVPDFLVNII